MLAAAREAKERLAQGVYSGRSASSSPYRQPVCSEDAAALLAHQRSSSSSHSSPLRCGLPPSPLPHSGFGAFGSGGASYDSTYASAYGGFAPPALPPRAATPSSPYAGWQGGALGRYVASPGKSPTGVEAGGELESEGDGSESDQPRVQPFVTCRLLCCYLLLLAMGVSFGMVANELHWSSLKKVHPWLEDLETWLHAPHNDPAHGGEYCEAGLVVPGPARTGANTLLFLALLLWAFLGVAIASDVFMSGIEKITSEEARPPARMHAARMPRCACARAP